MLSAIRHWIPASSGMTEHEEILPSVSEWAHSGRGYTYKSGRNYAILNNNREVAAFRGHLAFSRLTLRPRNRVFEFRLPDTRNLSPLDLQEHPGYRFED